MAKSKNESNNKNSGTLLTEKDMTPTTGCRNGT